MAKCAAMATGRTPRAIWEKRVERLRDSELTDVEYAAEIGVNVNTLRSWKWKLRDEKRARRRSKLSRRGQAKRPTFVEVAAPATTIELVVGGIEVRVPDGFDVATLSRVVAVLRAAS